MNARVTLADIAEALRVEKRSAERRAARESWPFDVEAVRGGSRRLYDPAELPKDVQRAVKARAERIAAAAQAAGQAADADTARRMLEDAARDGRLKGRELAEAAKQARADALLTRQAAGIEMLRRWPKLTANQVRRMQARLEIVQAYQRWLAADAQRHGNKSLNTFAASYCATGGASLAPETRETVRKLSGRNLRRWVDGFAAKGLAALLDEKDGAALAGHGKIEDQPEIRELVVGLLVELPHIRDQQIAHSISARFGTRLAAVTASLKEARAAGLLARPDVDAIRRFRLAWQKEHASAYLALKNPDKWKNQQMLAFGDASEDVTHPNYRWEMDSTPGDVLLLDPESASGVARYAVLGVVDVYGRRGKLLVAKTSKSAAIGSLVRRALLDWGRVERVKHDNGSDYCAHYLQTFFHAIGTEPELCEPFSGWQKPHIERFFRTFNHDLVELLPGYIGHDVAERKELEARASFGERLFEKGAALEVRMTADEFQIFCDDWVDNVYSHKPHAGLDGRTPFEVMAAWAHPVARVADERALDVLLMPLAGRDGFFSLQKKGIRIDNHHYIAAELGGYSVQSRFQVRRDVADAGRVYVFDDAGEFVCVATCPELLGISPAEIAAMAKAVQRRAVREEKAALRSAAKKAKVGDIVGEILRARAAQAGKLAAMPARGPAHSTPAIDAAGRAARAGESAPARAGQMVIGGRVVEAGPRPAAPATVTSLPVAAQKPRSERSAAENHAEWCALQEAVARGEQLSPVDTRFIQTWPTSSQGRMFLRKTG